MISNIASLHLCSPIEEKEPTHNRSSKVVAVVQAPLDVLPASLVCRCPAQLPPQKTDKVPEERLARGESYHHQAQKQPQPATEKGPSITVLQFTNVEYVIEFHWFNSKFGVNVSSKTYNNK